jgi:hypothetical protein
MNCSEYKRESTKTCAHDYIVPVLIKMIGELKLPPDTKILDLQTS